MDKKRILDYYNWTVIALGGLVIIYCAYHVSTAQLDFKFIVLALLTILLSSRVAIHIPNYSGHITVSDTFIFLTMLFYGPEPAVFLAAGEGAYSSLPYRHKPRTVAFNSAIMALATFASASFVGLLYSGPITDLPMEENSGIFLAAICVMAVVQYVANSGLAAIFTALSRNQGVIHTWSKYYLWTSISYLAGASAAGIISRLTVRFGFYYLILTAPIIFIIYLTYRTYIRSIETSAAQAEQAERERMRAHYSQMEKLSALGELASGVAHNFNNTLTGILARAQLLLNTDDREEIRRGLNIIIRTAEDGAKTVKRIQDFARQRRDQDFAPIDVDQLVREVAEITRPRWKDHAEAENVHIRLEQQIDSAATIMGDAGELREVLVNMVFNAVDAMPTGGTLTLSTRRAEDGVAIAISDTGVGMSEDVRTRIFDPFFTTKGKAGMGLGLSVSYGIIRRHEGTVDVESYVGRGSTFRIKLPVVSQAALPDRATLSVPPLATTRESLRVLVIDDEDYVRELLQDILEREGCKVSMAADGHEALNLFDQSEFDAVFTDVGLPGMSGWELARYIRERDKSIALAVVTGWGDAVSSAEQSEAQADWIVAKPFNIERIIALVDEISKRKATREVVAVND